jgi:hypothetical protein
MRKYSQLAEYYGGKAEKLGPAVGCTTAEGEVLVKHTIQQRIQVNEKKGAYNPGLYAPF